MAKAQERAGIPVVGQRYGKRIYSHSNSPLALRRGDTHAKVLQARITNMPSPNHQHVAVLTPSMTSLDRASSRLMHGYPAAHLAGAVGRDPSSAVDDAPSSPERSLSPVLTGWEEAPRGSGTPGGGAVDNSGHHHIPTASPIPMSVAASAVGTPPRVLPPLIVEGATAGGDTAGKQHQVDEAPAQSSAGSGSGIAEADPPFSPSGVLHRQTISDDDLIRDAPKIAAAARAKWEAEEARTGTAPKKRKKKPKKKPAVAQPKPTRSFADDYTTHPEPVLAARAVPVPEPVAEPVVKLELEPAPALEPELEPDPAVVEVAVPTPQFEWRDILTPTPEAATAAAARSEAAAAQAFAEFDTAGDGQIDREELRAGFAKMGKELSDGDIDTIMGPEKLPPPPSPSQSPEPQPGLELPGAQSPDPIDDAAADGVFASSHPSENEVQPQRLKHFSSVPTDLPMPMGGSSFDEKKNKNNKNKPRRVLLGSSGTRGTKGASILPKWLYGKAVTPTGASQRKQRWNKPTLDDGAAAAAPAAAGAAAGAAAAAEARAAVAAREKVASPEALSL